MQATPIQSPTILTHTVAGRYYNYGGNWVTSSDDEYSTGYYQFNELCGTGVEPDIEWEHQGTLVKKGDRLRGYSQYFRPSQAGSTEVEIYLAYRRPKFPDTALTDGMFADNLMENTAVYNDNFYKPNDADQPIFTPTGTRSFRRDIDNLDYEFTENGWLSIYIKLVDAGFIYYHSTANFYIETNRY